MEEGDTAQAATSLSARMDAISAISAEEITAFYKEKVTNKNCPCCGVDEWAFLDPPAGASAIFPVYLNSALIKELVNRLPVYLLTCDNCGFVRTFRTDKILKWRLAKNGR